VIELAASSVGVFQVLYFKSRKSQTNFSSKFVRDLSTKIRDLSAVTLQLNTGKSLKIKKSLSGI
jgi:hypothetical protein